MKNLRLILPGLLLAALTASGCWLISGQFVVSKNLPDPLTVGGVTFLVFAPIDLTTEGDYNDRKNDLKGLVDCALLGTFTNTGGNPLSVEVWLTPAPTTYTSETQLNADNTRVKVWGPFKLATGASRKIGWDESAALFTKAGKAALLSEVKGDGKFTLYAKGATAPYAFRVDKGVAVVVIDAGK